MLENKRTVLISGASKGVGASIAKAFNEKKFNLILVSRTFEKNYLKNMNNKGSIFTISKSIDDNKIYPSLNRTKIFTFQKRLFSATPLQKHLSAAMELLKEMIHADSRCIPLKHGRP